MEARDLRVVISGASGSLGHLLSQEFIRDGNHVIGIDRTKRDPAFPEQASYYQCDLADPNSVRAVVVEIFRIEERIDVVINNAGLIYNSPLVNLLNNEEPVHNSDGWKQTLNSNLHTTFNLTAEIAHRMVKGRQKGSIINISSISAAGNIGQSAYSASKAAINALTVTWSKELSMFGIRTNAISPGFFETPSTQNAMDSNLIKKWKKQIPLRRFGRPEELFHALRFIIENDYYNGQILELNGGLRI